MIKILFIIYSYPPEVRGGWQNFTKELAQEFARGGYKVTVISSRNKFRILNFKFIELENEVKTIRIPNLEIPFVKYIFELYATLFFSILELPDIIFGMSLSPGGIVSSFLGKILKAKNFLYLIGRELIESHPIFTKFVCNIFIRLSNKILCATDFAKGTLPFYVRDRAEIVPLFINMAEGERNFKNKESIKSLEAKYIILYVGRIIEEKGLDLLIKAIKIYKSKNPDSKLFLRVIGSGKKEKEYKLLAKNVLSESDYEFLGYRSNEELKQYFLNAHILVLPSRSETFGVVLLEANYFGLPVIATNVMGIPYVVKNGINGILVNPSAESIADGIEKLTKDEELYKRIKANAHDYAKEFTKENIVKQLRRVIKL